MLYLAIFLTINANLLGVFLKQYKLAGFEMNLLIHTCISKVV